MVSTKAFYGKRSSGRRKYILCIGTEKAVDGDFGRIIKLLPISLGHAAVCAHRISDSQR